MGIQVAKVVGPKKEKLAQSEQELAVVMGALQGKQDSLQVIMDKVAKLAAELEAKQNRKKQLEHEVQGCVVKLDRAQQLLSGLGGEKTRWRASSEQLQSQIDRSIGDVLLGAAALAYIGAFTSTYRQCAIAAWLEAAHKLQVRCSPTFALASVLGDPLQFKQWYIWGLPKDSFSTDNGVLINKSRRWPLCIDPQVCYAASHMQYPVRGQVC
jgi:dynein heavy chain, axonemal